MSIEQNIAAILLKQKAVFLSPEAPFTWTSGIKSPIYCDNRLLISNVEAREFIIRAFTELIRPHTPDLIAGTATAGIPWGAWVAHELKLPFCYVRSDAKAHGRKNAIEGGITKGQKVILIEDLISTGKSAIGAALKLREEELEVIKVMSIFSYQFEEAEKAFAQNNLSYTSLSNFEILTKVAYDNETLNEATFKQVLDWRQSVTFSTRSEV